MTPARMANRTFSFREPKAKGQGDGEALALLAVSAGGVGARSETMSPVSVYSFCSP